MSNIEYYVSMKSGLEDRNNTTPPEKPPNDHRVSMKSGLEGRNNHCGTRKAMGG